MFQRLLIEKMEHRIIVGTLSFLGIMVLTGWIAINEGGRMRSFERQFLARSIERGGQLFAANCSECHGLDGRGLTGAALLIFRSRDPHSSGFRAPGHPVTTALFVAACFAIVVATVATNLVNSLIGYAILLLGIPACRFWQRRNRITE